MPALEIATPLALKDFVGREIGVTPWFRVTQDHIERFAVATEDRQWIHVDRERAARESPYGTTIAHGFLTLSLLGHFLQQCVQIRGGLRSIVNYGLNRVRFPSPVPAESKIRARFTLQSLKELPDALEAVLLATVEAENAAKPCCIAEWVTRYNL
jgi:acyl dehydratase